MKTSKGIFVFGFVLFLMLASAGFAEVEWDIQRTLNLESAPLDVAVSLNGKWIFVLNDGGSIHIYAPNGALQEKIDVGSHVDGIRVGPNEDLLILTSKRDKTIQVLALDFITPVNVSGSPFKGAAEAPVVIAVFSDFE